MSRRAYLHVGTPKSGTSYLQDKLALNRALLEKQGLEYPRTRTGDHFEAALDLIGERWAGEEEAARGQWDALAVEAHRSGRDVLVSHEILAAAGPGAVAQALASFPDHEIHVVVTARDLGRQIPAEWQERVKHRGSREFAEFLKTLFKNYRRTDWSMWFWRVQHLPRMLATWGAALPPERVHLVTVPPQRRSAWVALDPVRRRPRPRPRGGVRRVRRRPTPPWAVRRSPCCVGSTSSSRERQVPRDDLRRAGSARPSSRRCWPPRPGHAARPPCPPRRRAGGRLDHGLLAQGHRVPPASTSSATSPT